jgi:hypothetical protein
MAKKIYDRDLVRYDGEHGTSLRRELEMAVEAGLSSAGYAVQFWRDMGLYGLDEAITYLGRSTLFSVGSNSNWMNLTRTVNKIRQAFFDETVERSLGSHLVAETDHD